MKLDSFDSIVRNAICGAAGGVLPGALIAEHVTQYSPFVVISTVSILTALLLAWFEFKRQRKEKSK